MKVFSINFSSYYIKNFAFVYKIKDDYSSYETCKELACNSTDKYLAVVCSSEKLLETALKYSELLGLPRGCFEKVEVYCKDGIKIIGVGITGYLNQNKVTREIGATLLKSISRTGLVDLDVNFENLFLDNYYKREKIRLIFRNLVKFIDSITPKHLEKCNYNFNSNNGHGGILNWTSRGYFDNILKQFDKQPNKE